jgi:AmmeMemoRadiSam system protein B
MTETRKIRPAAVAGRFYSGKKLELEREVAMYLENAPDIDIPGQILGIVAPHAGYMYSAGVAARAYRQIIDMEIDIVAVVSPSHSEYFNEISVYDGYAYETPLGNVPVARELAEDLADLNPQIILSEKGHRFDEHALEVQLPLLQKVLDHFTLLPIIIGEQNYDNLDTLAKALGTVLHNRNALIVASSDLSHFYDTHKAETLDSVVSNDIKNFNEDDLFAHLNSGDCEMCGGGPVVATMKACKLLGADQSRVLKYRTSGDITGDQREVVGYLSAVFYKSDD